MGWMSFGQWKAMVLRVARHQRRLRFRTVASSDKRPSPVSVRNERLYFSVLVNSRLEFLHDFDHRFIVCGLYSHTRL